MDFRHPGGFSVLVGGRKTGRDGDTNPPVRCITPASLMQECMMYKAEKQPWGPETLSAYSQFSPGFILLNVMSEILSRKHHLARGMLFS